MIELRNVSKTYSTTSGKHTVFKGLSFSFDPDRNVALLGRNGAGKSTLIRLLGGVDAPDSGSIVTHGKRISWPVNFSSGIQPTLSGRDAVKFACRVLGVHGDMRERALAFVKEFAGLGDSFDRPVKTYSSGMRSRLAFGLTMAFEFDYYLIDEVMAVGDAEFRDQSRSVLLEKMQRARILMVSHSMKQIRELCDQVVILSEGVLRAFEDLEEGIRAYQGDAYNVPRSARATAGGRRALRVVDVNGNVVDVLASSADALLDSYGSGTGATPAAPVSSDALATNETATAPRRGQRQAAAIRAAKRASWASGAGAMPEADAPSAESAPNGGAVVRKATVRQRPRSAVGVGNGAPAGGSVGRASAAEVAELERNDVPAGARRKPDGTKWAKPGRFPSAKQRAGMRRGGLDASVASVDSSEPHRDAEAALGIANESPSRDPASSRNRTTPASQPEGRAKTSRNSNHPGGPMSRRSNPGRSATVPRCGLAARESGLALMEGETIASDMGAALGDAAAQRSADSNSPRRAGSRRAASSGEGVGGLGNGRPRATSEFAVQRESVRVAETKGRVKTRPDDDRAKGSRFDESYNQAPASLAVSHRGKAIGETSTNAVSGSVTIQRRPGRPVTERVRPAASGDGIDLLDARESRPRRSAATSDDERVKAPGVLRGSARAKGKSRETIPVSDDLSGKTSLADRLAGTAGAARVPEVQHAAGRKNRLVSVRPRVKTSVMGAVSSDAVGDVPAGTGLRARRRVGVAAEVATSPPQGTKHGRRRRHKE